MPTTAPTTPNPTTPRRVAMNRSFTVPTRLASAPRDAEIGAAEGIETLYVHPSANIVKFTTAGLSRPSSSAGSPRARTLSSTGLSWSSTTESTIAAGPLEIYRVPGSVSFLHSGALLHAILPRSQCWCVDGVSKFALRVLPETYYRIELPGVSEEDLELVEGMKEVLKKVLFYERTPCPFVRGFEVEGADVDLEQEVRKGRRKSAGSAKRWTLNRPYSWKPEDGEEIREEGDGESGSEGSGREQAGHRQGPPAKSAGIPGKAPTVPPRGYASMRSITAPPQLSKRPSVRARVQSVETTEAQRAERTPRPLSMRIPRTLQTIPTNMPPSPPESSAGADSHDVEPAIAPSAETGDIVTPEPRREDEDQDGPDAPEESEDEHDSDELEHDEQEHDDTAIPFQLPFPKPETSFSTQTDTISRPAISQPEQTQPETQPHEPHVPHAATEAPIVSSPPAASSQPPSQLPTTTTTPSLTPSDPYAAIQARILARRTIGTPTTSPKAQQQPQPQPSLPPPTLRPKPSLATFPHQPSLPTALASKALTLFLGPPAHLVAIMLRIAARFAKGTSVGSVFLVESPANSEKRVPGSFDLEEDLMEGWGQEGEEDGDEEADDFGVPLRSPARVMRGR